MFTGDNVFVIAFAIQTTQRDTVILKYMDFSNGEKKKKLAATAAAYWNKITDTEFLGQFQNANKTRTTKTTAFNFWCTDNAWLSIHFFFFLLPFLAHHSSDMLRRISIVSGDDSPVTLKSMLTALVCQAQPNLLCHPIKSELAYVIARNEVSSIFLFCICVREKKAPDEMSLFGFWIFSYAMDHRDWTVISFARRTSIVCLFFSVKKMGFYNFWIPFFSNHSTFEFQNLDLKFWTSNKFDSFHSSFEVKQFTLNWSERVKMK